VSIWAGDLEPVPLDSMAEMPINVVRGDTATCTRCGLDRPIEEFGEQVERGGGRRLKRWCRTCNSDYQREYRVKNINEITNRNLIARYGITQNQYDEMLAAQGGVCAICRGPNTQVDSRTGKVRRFHVDHDHETGTVRGLLCHFCNVVLGMVEDDVERLRLLIDY
jgi:hypothetical protein